MEKSALAYRTASEEGLTGTAFDARVGDVWTFTAIDAGGATTVGRHAQGQRRLLEEPQPGAQVLGDLRARLTGGRRPPVITAGRGV